MSKKITSAIVSVAIVLFCSVSLTAFAAEDAQDSPAVAVKAKDNIETIKSDNAAANNAVVIGIVCGLLGFAVSLFDLYIFYQKKASIEDRIYQSNKKLHDKIQCDIEAQVSSSERRLRKEMDERCAMKHAIPTKETLQDMVEEIVSAHLKPKHADLSGSGRTVDLQPMYYLYARDSSTNTLSNISQEYSVGKSVYKLVLSSPDSIKAEVDLCLEKDDLLRRVLQDPKMLSPICEVHVNSRTPKRVEVKELGRAEKTGGAQWNVTSKMSVEID